MNRVEYMNQLQERLEKFGKELQKEILEDYSQHFAEGQAAGRTDEEIIQELGDIEDMIRELRTVEAEAERSEEGNEAGAQQDDGTGAEESAAQDEAGRAEGKEEKNRTHTPNGGIYYGDFKGAVLKTGVADILLEQSEDDAVHVEYQNSGSLEDRQKYEYYQYEKDGVFCAGIRKNKNYNDGRQRSFSIGPTTITFNNNFFNRGARNENLALIVKVPRKMPEVKTETSSGDITVSSLALEKIKCATVSGDITVQESMLKKVESATSSGDVKLIKNTVEKGKTATVSGDVEVQESTMTGMEILSSSGDITAVNDIVEELEINVSSGDIELQDLQSRLVKLNTSSGDVKISLVKAVEGLKANTSSGDVDIRFRETEGAEVQVNSHSGDIDLSYKGGRVEARSGMTYRFGDSSSRVSVNTSSGDISIDL